jgi:enoyl-CoA hydratase
MAPKILVERTGFVTTVIINRPEVRNALDREAAAGLARALREFDADDEARVAVLCGAGGAFCSGATSRNWRGAPITSRGRAVPKGRCMRPCPSP